jgi:hypothetical protein
MGIKSTLATSFSVNTDFENFPEKDEWLHLFAVQSIINLNVSLRMVNGLGRIVKLTKITFLFLTDHIKSMRYHKKLCTYHLISIFFNLNESIIVYDQFLYSGKEHIPFCRDK